MARRSLNRWAKSEFLEPDAKASPIYEVLTVKLNFPKKMKSKPRTPAYVEEVYHRIEVEMCTARNAVVALDLRIGHIVAKLPPEDQAEVEAALKDYNVTVCTAISKAGGLLAALDPRDVETLPKVWAPLDDPRNPKSSIAARNNP